MKISPVSRSLTSIGAAAAERSCTDASKHSFGRGNVFKYVQLPGLDECRRNPVVHGGA